MTYERPNITTVNIEPDQRDAVTRVGELLRQHHGGRGGISRGLTHIVKVYLALPEAQRAEHIANDRG